MDNSIQQNKVSNLKVWWLSIVFTIPVILFYLSHFLVSTKTPDLLATGFIHYDMPYYVSNALEYKETADFHFCHSLPFSDNYKNEQIYFHPQIFVMGMILRYFPINPLFLYLLLGFIFSVLTIRICLLLLLKYVFVPSSIFTLISLLFIWGGGILFLLGFGLSFMHGMDLSASLNHSFFLDPFDGWWFLNLGRNFIFPMEAYYHFLFFLTVYFICCKNIYKAILVTILLAISHPFTGIALLIIFLGWIFLEKIFFKK